MAHKGRVKRITHIVTGKEDKDFQDLEIEGTKTTAQPKTKEIDNGKCSD